MKVLCNTSSLLLLARIDRLDLLPALYDDLIVPTAVLEEVSAQDDEVARHIREQVQHTAFQVREASAKHLGTVTEDLGKGERAAIALALETEADLIILDDEQGRQAARKHGLGVTGISAYSLKRGSGSSSRRYVGPRSPGRGRPVDRRAPLPSRASGVW